MNFRNSSRVLAVAGVLLVTATSFAAVKPLTTTGQAARAVATGMLIREDAQKVDYEFGFFPRDHVAGLFGQLAAVTTFRSLLLAPAGVAVNCPDGGTFTARLSSRTPRVLSIELRQCARVQFATRSVEDGPVEVALLEDTFTPTAVASIHFGGPDRDLVVNVTNDPTQLSFLHETVYRNLRVTGYLPMQRLGDDSAFAGRYLGQVSGFSRRVSEFPDYDSSGQPSEAVYPHEYAVSTSGVLLSGQFTHVGNTYGTEVSFLAGDFNERYVRPSTPSNPIGQTVRKSYGGTGLRVVWGYNGTRSRYNFSIDGTSRTDYNEWSGFGCAKPDEFSYRTRTLLEYIPSDYTGHMFDSGLMTINGNATATFTATGTDPYIDRVGHVAIDIPGVGHATYDVNGFVYGSELLAAGVCTR